MTFLRLRKMPKMPSVNRIAATERVMAEPDGHDQIPLPRLDLDDFHRGFLGPRDLLGDVLALDAGPVAQRQHDGADHGDQQHQAGGLEVIDVLRVEHAAERLGVGDGGRDRRRDRLRHARPDHPGADHQQQFGQEHDADQHADRQILQEALAQLGEIDVEHHHDEQEQHRDRADIDHDQDHRQELGAHQHEQARGVDEGENEKQHRMHGVLRRDHHEGGRHADAGKEIEEQSGQDHRGARPHRYGASSAMFLAISRSQRSPFASSLSLS